MPRHPASGTTRNSALLFPRLEIALHIFPQNIRLEIHRVTHNAIAQIGVRERKRNYRDLRDATVPARHRQTDAVHSDRPFRHNVTRKFLWNPYAQPPAIVSGSFSAQFSYASNAVHVSQNKM